MRDVYDGSRGYKASRGRLEKASAFEICMALRSNAPAQLQRIQIRVRAERAHINSLLCQLQRSLDRRCAELNWSSRSSNCSGVLSKLRAISGSRTES